MFWMWMSRGKEAPTLNTNVSKIWIWAFFHNVCSLLFLTVFHLFGIRFVHFINWIQPECLFVCVRVCWYVCLSWNASVCPIVFCFFTWSSRLSFFDVSCWWTRNQPKMLRLEKVESCNEWWCAGSNVILFHMHCVQCYNFGLQGLFMFE